MKKRNDEGTTHWEIPINIKDTEIEALEIVVTYGIEQEKKYYDLWIAGQGVATPHMYDYLKILEKMITRIKSGK